MVGGRNGSLPLSLFGLESMMMSTSTDPSSKLSLGPSSFSTNVSGTASTFTGQGKNEQESGKEQLQIDTTGQ